MSTSREVIELLFNAEYKGGPEIRALKKDLNELAGDFSSGVSVVSGFTAALGAMELAAVAVAIGLAKAGVQAAGEFNGQFAEISTLVNATDEDLQAFKTSVQTYASTSTASIESINSALYNAISAGVDYKKSIEFLAVAEKLSVAGKTDLNSAVQVLTGTLNAYGLETDQAGKVSDVLFSTVKNGVTTIPELVASLGKITGTASALGVSFEEIGAATSTLTKNGVNTAESMTLLKAIITSIIKPNKEAKETADELGISLGTQALESKGLAGVLSELALKTGGSKEQMSKLFGSTEALNGALILTSQNGLKNFNADLLSATNSAGATDTAFKKMADNMDLVKQTLANNIELTLGAIGEPLLKEFADIDKSIGSIFNTIRTNLTAQDGALVPVINSVERLAGTVADIIRSMSKNMDEALKTANLSGFSRAFDAINAALKGLDLTSPQGLAKAIGLLGDAFSGLTKFTLSAGEVLKNMLEVFGQIGSYLNSLDGDFASSAGTIGGWAIALAAASVPFGILISLLTTIKGLGGIVGAMGSAAAVGAVSTALSGLVSAVPLAAAAFAGFKIGGQFVEGIDAITGFSSAMAGASKITPGLQAAIDEYAKSIGKSTVSVAEYNAAMRAKYSTDSQSQGALDNLNKSTNQQNDSMGAVTLTTKLSVEELKKWNEFVANGYSWTEKSTQSIEANSESLKKLSQTAKPATENIKALGDASNTAKSKVDALSAIKPVFDFQTAKVQSQAKEIEAIMSGLGTSIKATGDSLSSAFNFMSGQNFNNLGIFEKSDVIDSIRDMSQAQLELSQAEANFVNAKAKYMQSQAQAVQNGDAMIKIDGTNLAPQLEAFMFEILKSVQMRVSSNFSDFLVGLPAST